MCGLYPDWILGLFSQKCFVVLFFQCAILHLNDVINKLSCDPGKFDLLAKPIVDELSPMLAVEEIVENAAMLIIDQVC